MLGAVSVVGVTSRGSLPLPPQNGVVVWGEDLSDGVVEEKGAWYWDVKWIKINKTKQKDPHQIKTKTKTNQAPKPMDWVGLMCSCWKAVTTKTDIKRHHWKSVIGMGGLLSAPLSVAVCTPTWWMWLFLLCPRKTSWGKYVNLLYAFLLPDFFLCLLKI